MPEGKEQIDIPQGKAYAMSMNEPPSSEKFEEALRLLNEAARDKKEELQGLLGDKYSEIRELLEEAIKHQKNNFDQARRVAEDWAGDGGDGVRAAVEDLDDKVHENPWPYIGGVAASALLLGFLLGSSSKNK